MTKKFVGMSPVGLLNTGKLSVRVQAGGKVIWRRYRGEAGCIVLVDKSGEVAPDSDRMPTPFILSECDFSAFVQIIARTHGLKVAESESLSSDRDYFVTVVLCRER